MNDVFIEQLIKKKPTMQDTLLKALIVFGGVSICCVALMFITSAFFGSIAMLVAVGAIYFAWVLITSMNLEYEYIYTNGEIDIDRISGKRRRKRITTVKITSFEFFEKYDHEKQRSQKYDVKIMACTDINDPATFCAAYRGKENKHCLLVFTPNEKLLESISALHRRKRV